MKYIMLIYQGPALERQAALPEEEQKQVYAERRFLERRLTELAAATGLE